MSLPAPVSWPLNDAQRVVWLDLRLRAHPLAYQLGGQARLHGPLDTERFQAAVAQAMAEHDALRLRIDPHEPRQYLAPADTAPPLRWHRLDDAASADSNSGAAEASAAREARLAALTRGIHAEALGLDGGPLFAIDAVRLRTDLWVMVWRCSHLIADGYAVWLKVKAIAAAYRALGGAGEAAPGSSFVATLDAELAPASRTEADRAHWRERLADPPAPVFEPREAAAAISGAESAAAVQWTLAGEDYRRWNAACAREGLSTHRVLLALLALAVGTRLGREDLIVGMALHGRTRATREVVGMFSGVLPVRCTWSARDDRLIDAVRRTALALERDYRHRRLPVDDIARQLGRAVQGRARLFDISLSYLPVDADAIHLDFGDAQAVVERQYPGAIVPLPLDVMDHAREERLDLSLGHDPTFLDADQAQGLAEALQRAMQAWMDDAGQPLRALSPVSPAERASLLDAFQPRWRADFPLDRPLHALVHEQARARPEAVAVEDGERRLSYAQLDALSEVLAERLRPCWPAGRAEPVAAVALPRSMETVVALLATLKAGGVYLPLDTAHPLPRLQYQLDDARADVLIDALDLDGLGHFDVPGGLGHAACRTPALPGAERVPRLDTPPRAPRSPTSASALAGVPPPEAAWAPQRLAYLIYTSGSTGEPKPVGVSHRAAVNLAYARQDHDPLGPGDKVLAAISVGFDVSIGQLLLPLLSGATIVIAPPLQRLEPEAFWALLARHGVTHINSVPSFFDTVSEALMARPPEARYRGLKRLMLGGEALTGALATRLHERLPGTQLVNMYGPTETCIDATAYPVPAGPLPAALPIGRPLPNYRAYVLDAVGRLLPPGVPGELCLGGAGVARGYIGREALTAEKFGDDPYADPAQPDGDRRLYRSGDVARWRADGQIEFLGRNDQQVKIRGHRIETGEIEAVLLRQPGVQQAAVIAAPDARGELQLAAYLVAVPGTLLEPATLRPALATALPGHMLPASMQCIDTLPLTTNGKLDRKALPAPQFDAPLRAAVTPPQGPLETLLAGLWSELLGVSPVGRDDHFFDLGGHSLLALKLVDRLRQAGWQTEVSALFAEPTLQALAANCVPVEAGATDAPAGPAGLPPGCTRITPDLLPGLDLSEAQIDAIVAQGPGRAEAVQDIVALAPLQQGMLYHHLMQDEGDVFLSPFIVAFADEDRLQTFLATLQRVIERHDILRTGVVWEGLPEAVQVVWREARLPVEDLGRAPSAEALARLQAHVDPRHLRIDLRRPPLLRAVVLREEAGRPLLALVLHHLALDHGAMEIVLAEVAALATDAQAPLPPSMPLRAVVAQARRPGAAEAAERHFRAELGDIDQPTTPWGLATLPTEDDALTDHVQAVDTATVAALRRQAAAAGVSLSSLLHLAYALVLARSSGRDDLVFGTVLLGQWGQLGQAGSAAQAQGARALGMMINTLPLRLRLEPATPLRAALQATQAALAALMPHEHTPLALAQRCSAVEAPAPLFTALFNVRHRLAPAAGTGPLGLELVWAHERTGYPLAMAVDLAEDAMQLSAQALAPVDPAQVNALMAQALQALLAPLDQPLSAIDVLSAAERQRLLHDFQPPTPPIAPTGLHTAVHAQAARTPSAPAVIDGERVLSYRELELLSDALAARLRAVLDRLAPGVDEAVVGVALPRSADTVVALLAILKAGAVYLPLDIAYPVQRLQYMLDDAQARLLIDAPGQPGTAGLQAHRLDGVAGDSGQGVASPPSASESRFHPAPDDPQRLAYIIYTSGSTGLPKAVGVPHRAAVNLAQARMGHDPIGPGDRILAAISVGFDVSIGQLLLPLLSGATVVIAPPLQGLGPEAFWALLARHGVTHINSVPSFFDAVSEALPGLPEDRRYRGLKRLMLGGEVLTGALARKLQERLPGTGLVNMYGPTEACIDATAYPVPASGALPGALPIGRPLPNYRAYVLDAHDRLAPVGVAGELCLAGAGLARGYVGRPEATAEKFVPDPYAEGTPFAGGRMYRTGDHARWRADGQIEFLGRRDEQVKIRGHRVETGEIEAVLLQDPALRQAAVRPCRDGDRPGWAFLAAYLVAAGPARPDDEALRRRLAAALPEHMIPLAWIWIDALPITPNGKLDVKALPAPTATLASGGRENLAPRSPLEARLLAVWHQAFERSDFGVTDNFFELGGQSLRAMRLLTACQAALREEGLPAAWAEASHRLSLRQLLQAPTVEGLAALVEPSADAPTTRTPMLPLVALREGSAPPLYAVHPQGGHVLCFAALARSLPPDLPVYGLQAPGLEEGETPFDDLSALAAHHVAAIQAWQPEGPLRLLGYSAGGVIAQEMARQLLEAGRRVTMLMLLDAPVPGQPPLTDPPDEDRLQRELTESWARLREASSGAPESIPESIPEATLDLAQDAALNARILATSRAMAQALRRHRAQPLPLDLRVVRAQQRDDALPDWQPLVAAPGKLSVLDLDTDHHRLLDAAPAAHIAAWVADWVASGPSR